MTTSDGGTRAYRGSAEKVSTRVLIMNDVPDSPLVAGTPQLFHQHHKDRFGRGAARAGPGTGDYGMATKKISSKTAAPLDSKVADRLLDLLSTDNEFRRLFKKDPQAALVKAGWKPPAEPTAAAGSAKARKGPPFTPPGPPSSVPPVMCLKVDRIAPKEQIVKARMELKSFLTSALGQIPQRLDAGYIRKPIRKR